ncbi:hypothetical protein PILCRDRAFT_825627 [Piloderma croceum F 1598]|uniref:Uncharacterized protein n=1 Tax=Piloderma croceum (strain F 1598) TaxID=765440 RepID=A0A0C3BIE3_PILCF|nr:hypothetical protein PILCRDRAFT_825627 [Piloderma croceum F 1598]
MADSVVWASPIRIRRDNPLLGLGSNWDEKPRNRLSNDRIPWSTQRSIFYWRREKLCDFARYLVIGYFDLRSPSLFFYLPLCIVRDCTYTRFCLFPMLKSVSFSR